MTDDKNYERRANKIIFFGGIIALCVILIKLLWKAILPFAVAWILSLPIRKAAETVSDKTGISKKLAACALLILVLLGMSFGIRALVTAGSKEATLITQRLGADSEAVSNTLKALSDKAKDLGGLISSLYSVTEDLGLSWVSEGVREGISRVVSEAVSGIAGLLSGTLISFTQTVASFAVLCIVFLLSFFYFCCDGREISDFFLSLVPKIHRDRLISFKNKISDIAKRYIGASLLMSLITFFTVLVGMLVIRCEYALTVAIFAAIADFLPILGAGAVLLPLAGICFLLSDIRGAVAFIIVWAVAALVHQIVEPKIIGKSIGVHPVAALISAYIGASLLGFRGLIIAPIICASLKSLLPNKQKKRGE